MALDLKRRARLLIAPSVFLAIAGYFIWNVTQGNRGLAAYQARLELLERVKADNKAASVERAQWETRVAGLRASNLNPDTVDERARAMLNLADPTDVVVQYSAKDRLF